jgi:hypothetical protein
MEVSAMEYRFPDEDQLTFMKDSMRTGLLLNFNQSNYFKLQPIQPK